MKRELTDAEVFGAGQPPVRELTDAEVFAKPKPAALPKKADDSFVGDVPELLESGTERAKAGVMWLVRQGAEFMGPPFSNLVKPHEAAPNYDPRKPLLSQAPEQRPDPVRAFAGKARVAREGLSQATKDAMNKEGWAQVNPRNIAASVVESAPSLAASAAMVPFTGPGGAVAMETALASGSSGQQTEETVRDWANANPKEFAASPRGKAALKATNGDFKKAVEMVANESAGKAALITGAITPVASLVTGNFSGKVLAGQAPKSLADGVRQGVVREGIEEAAQSSGEQYAQNEGVQGVLPRSRTEGVPEAAVMGAVTGGLMGGGLGATAGGANQRTGKPVAPAAPAEELSDADVFGPQAATNQQDNSTPPPQPKARAFTEADARAVIKGIGGKVTSGYRTPEHNAEVGGVKGSYHTRGKPGAAQAIDVVPPKGMTMADLETNIRRRMPHAKVINEGDHVHVQWGGQAAKPKARGESLADDLESAIIADEATIRADELADAPAPGPARSADRPASDGSGTSGARAGDETPASPAGDDIRFGHIDDNHARLYDLGKKAEAGELDGPLADDLAKRMSPLIDWTDEPNLTKKERRALRNGEPVSGRRMVEVAKDYARRFDEHGPEARTSFYDPDKYHDAMVLNRTPEPQDAPTPRYDPFGDNRPEIDLNAIEPKLRTYVETNLADSPGWKRDASRYYIAGAMGEAFEQPAHRANPSATADFTAMARQAWEAGSQAFPANRAPEPQVRMADDAVAAAAPERVADDVPNLTPLRAEARGPMAGERVAQPVTNDVAPDVNMNALLHDLRQAFGTTHRTGRVRGGKNVMGHFDRSTQVVRTRALRDIGVLAHEIGHDAEFRRAHPSVETAMAAHAPLLKTFDYEPAKGRRHEGFAEWFRWYVTNPAEAKAKAPQFYDDFEAALATDNPKALEKVRGVQAGYDQWLKADTLKTMAGDVAFTGDKGVIGEGLQQLKDDGGRSLFSRFLDRAYAFAVNKNYGLRVLEQEFEKAFLVKNGMPMDRDMVRMPSHLAGYATPHVARKAAQLDAAEGVVPIGGALPEGPSISDAIAAVFGKGAWNDRKLNELDAYLTARRMIHEWDRHDAGEIPNAPSIFSKAEHETAISQFEAKYGEAKAKEAARLIYEWNGNMWRKMRDGHIITPEMYDAGLKMPDYVPLNRDVSDKAAGQRNGKPRSDSMVKRFKGSDRAVVSPIYSMMMRAVEVNMFVRHNAVVRAMDDMSRLVGGEAFGGGGFIERLPKTEAQAYNVKLNEAISAAAKDANLSPVDVVSLQSMVGALLGDDPRAKVFGQRKTKGRSGELVVPMWDKGEVVPILIDSGREGRDIYRALEGMSHQQHNWLIDGLGHIAALVRSGITMLPDFWVRNIVGGEAEAWVNHGQGYKPGVSLAKGAKSALSNDQFSKMQRAMGGIGGGSETHILKGLPTNDRQAKRVRGQLHPVKFFRPGKNVINAFTAITDLSERSMRLGAVRESYKRAKARGLSDGDAAFEATVMSDDVLNFSRHGSGLITLARIIPFLGSAIQGTDKWARTTLGTGFDRPSGEAIGRALTPILKHGAKMTPAQKRQYRYAGVALMKVALMATFGASLTALFMNEDWFQALTPMERSRAWYFKVPGNDQVFQWRKPFQHAVLNNAAEAFIESKYGNNEGAADDFREGLMSTFGMPTSIPGLSIWQQVERNRNHFGQPIVPEHLEGVDPELQYNAWTSHFSRQIGAKMGWSPAVMDHVMTNAFAPSRELLKIYDKAHAKATGKPLPATGPEDTPGLRPVTADPYRSTKDEDRFWKEYGETPKRFETAQETFRLMASGQKDGDAIAYLRTLDPASRAYVLSRYLAKGNEQALHPVVRAKEASAVLSELRRDMSDGKLTTFEGEPIKLTPEQMRDVNKAIAKLRDYEFRNALIAMREKGWRNKERGDTGAVINELGEIDPRLPPLIDNLMAEAKVPSEERSLAAFESIRDVLEGPVDEAFLRDAMDRKNRTTTDPKRKREARLAQGLPMKR